MVAKKTNSATVMSSETAYRPTTTVGFDIETAPLQADGGDSNALLNPQTARVCAIGYYEPSLSRYLIAYDQDEAGMLRQFWDAFLSANGAGAKMIGFNIFSFDLPFMVRRSWHHGVKVPANATTYGWKSWSPTFIDLMHEWRCGEWKTFISLDALSRYLGVGQKVGEGERFFQLWEKDRKAAVAYLENDVRLAILCAQKMSMLA